VVINAGQNCDAKTWIKYLAAKKSFIFPDKSNPSGVIKTGVARWYIFVPKIPIWVYFGEP
jgi:hypothetical protein